MVQIESIYNLFVYSTFDLITEVGVVKHEIHGSDQEKIKFLQDNVTSDLDNVKKFDLPNNFKIKINGVVKKGIDYTTYRELCAKGHELSVFENSFQYFNVSANPLVVITPVRNGKIFIEGTENIKISNSEIPKFIHIDKQKEWYVDYIDSNGFHFDKLIDDDFFSAIRILYNERHYVSSMKLLMICLDTVSFLEFGDVKKNFHTWLDSFTDLDKMNITADELWEFRNSILHMTNLDSRKVQANQVKRLMFYTANSATNHIAEETDEGKYFKFKDLLDTLAAGIGNWGHTYNTHKEKFSILLTRYDRIISDKRSRYIYYENKFNV